MKLKYSLWAGIPIHINQYYKFIDDTVRMTSEKSSESSVPWKCICLFTSSTFNLFILKKTHVLF